MKNLIVLFLIFAAIPTWALVDMRNANFSDTWVDLSVPGEGYDLKVTRGYNSRSLNEGMFGFGWCSEFETTFQETAEGNVKVTECGDGLEILYISRGFDHKDVDKVIGQILSKEKSTGKNSRYLSSLKKQLEIDQNLRSSLAKKHGVSSHSKEGTKYYANGRANEYIVKKDNYFLRSLGNGTSQRFSTNGKLIQTFDRNRNYLKFHWKGDVLDYIIDNSGKKLTFKFYPSKKVKEIIGPGKLKAEYKYKNKDLIWAKIGKESYSYDYDSLHNLTKIMFPDKTTKEIKYDEDKDWVTSFKHRDSCIEKYSYTLSKEDPDNHYWSTVEKQCGKKITNKSRFEFWYKNRRDKGGKYLARLKAEVNKDSTDVHYHEKFSSPTLIERNGVKTAFTYYKSGLLKSKKVGKISTVFYYHKKHMKVSKVKSGKIVTNFRYDNRGNLVRASNSTGQDVRLSYDSKGRIESLKDQAKRTVKITYDSRYGKPSRVERPGIGAIDVVYKKSGEIERTQSKQGPEVAVQIASTFNSLLDIISPTGVDIGL